jgi:hypothetical protein
VVEFQIQVLEKRQEVLPEVKEAVRFRFMDHRRTKVLPVEVSGTLQSRDSRESVD